MTARRAWLSMLALALASSAQAQVRRPDTTAAPPVPSRAATPARGVTDQDPALRDTTIQWTEPDSVMQSLLLKPGYSITRYEGDVVTFDALTKALMIAAGTARQAQVQREGQRVVSDSAVVYNDATNEVFVGGRFQIALGEGQAPIAGRGAATYNLTQRAGRLTNASVTIEESGQRWFINSEIGKTALGDTTRGIPQRFYGLGGSLTSCEDSIPDYHFQMREIKRRGNTLVARPAVLYLQDVPVMWLPFVFQDIRPGRRSGILPPRFGASDIVRNNPGYRRNVENMGYYWALSDYMDATTWVDWRSGAGGDSIDPGWYKANAEWKYTWRTRFLQGRLASSYMQENDGDNNFALSWGHQQRLSRNRNFSTDVNYVTSTRLQRQNTFNPALAMATIRSSVSYSDKIGPASLQLGGSRTQYPGRQQIDQRLPTVSISTGSIDLAPWLVWTPNFSYSESATLRIDHPGTFNTRFRGDDDGRLIGVDTLKRNKYDRTITFDTPLRIFGFDFRNGVRIRDQLNEFPEEKDFFSNVPAPGADSSVKERRVYRSTFRTDVDWNPSFSLPAIAQNRFKITPSISLQNVDPNPFWVRTEASNGRFVHQSKRLSYGVSASPSVFGLWPGFGPFQRIRHGISPVLSYSFAPRANISSEFLTAVGTRREGYLGALPQSAVSLSLSQNIEAKVRTLDTAATGAAAQKMTLLSMQFTPLSYDFERAKFVGRSLAGLTTQNFGTTMSSELLPGMNLSADWSLFQGNTISDTAVFSPYLTRVTSSFRVSQSENPFAVITRLFGRAVPDQSPAPQPGSMSRDDDAALTRELASQPVAGQASRGTQFVVPPGRGWQATVNFSTSRPRPMRGEGIIDFDPRVRCEPIQAVDPFGFDECVRLMAAAQDDPPESTTAGGPAYRSPPQTSLSNDLRFELTQKWAASWNTSYDFQQRQFAAQVVSLQRDLHDWRAVFAFTKSPNGNFAFTFFIALKPQPDLKFDYSRASVRQR